MNRPIDWIITLTLVAVGCVLAGSALMVTIASGSIGGAAAFPIMERRGEPLFPNFPPPTKVGSLTITDYNAELDQTSTFEVTKKDGRWVLPSQGGYPADAEDQLARAATALIDLPILEVKPLGVGGAETSGEDEHATFGVVAPTDEELAEEKTGVGKLVTFADEAGNTLASLIIGRSAATQDEGPGAIPSSSQLHFVRIAGQDPVYVVDLDPALYTADFGSWINRDLLAVNPFDVESMTFDDYSLLLVQQRGGLTARLTPGPRITVNRNEEAGRWDLAKMTVPGAGGVEADQPLPPGKVLSAEALDGARDALKGLSIVDVQRKPEGLQADLTVSESVQPSLESQLSLQQHGFFLRGEGAEQELYAANGETIVRLRGGVNYVLRFGETANRTADAGTDDVRRYLMVTARVDEAKFPAPQPPGDEAPATGEAAPADAAKPDEAAKSDGEAEPDAAKADAAKADDVDAKEEAMLREIEAKAAKEKREAEYQEKLKAWRASRQKAENEAQRLNARFADWYYVIDDAMYQKLHLTKDAIVVDRPADAAAGGTTPPGSPPTGLPPGIMPPPSPEVTIEPEPTLPPEDLPPVERFRRMSEMELPPAPAAAGSGS